MTDYFVNNRSLNIPIVLNIYLKDKYIHKHLQVHISSFIVPNIRQWIKKFELLPIDFSTLVFIRELTDQVLVYTDIDTRLKFQYLHPSPIPGEIFTLTQLPIPEKSVSVTIIE